MGLESTEHLHVINFHHNLEWQMLLCEMLQRTPKFPGRIFLLVLGTLTKTCVYIYFFPLFPWLIVNISSPLKFLEKFIYWP